MSFRESLQRGGLQVFCYCEKCLKHKVIIIKHPKK